MQQKNLAGQKQTKKKPNSHYPLDNVSSRWPWCQNQLLWLDGDLLRPTLYILLTNQSKGASERAGESEQNYKKEGRSHKNIPKHQHGRMSFYCHLGEGTVEDKQQ